MKTNRIAHALVAAMILGTVSVPAFAVDLPFSADCANTSAIQVSAPETGITFRKNPNSPDTRAATATIARINGHNNITIPANVSSCFYTVQGTDNYCFQASSNAGAFTNINAVANTNVAEVPACQ